MTDPDVGEEIPPSPGSGGAIVVGVDGSEGSRHALAWAVAEARLRRRPLRVVHAWSPPPPIEIEGVLWDEDLERNRAAAELVVTSMLPLDARDVVVEGRAVQGEAPVVLLSELRTDASLLVVGSRGHGGFASLLLGSVAEHCSRCASAPVVVVHDQSPLPGDGEVVVGIDGSEGSSAALMWAIDEAAARGSALTVAHAWWNAYWVPSPGFGGVPYPTIDLRASSETLLHDMVDGALTSAPRRPPSVELLAIGDLPSRGLLERSIGAGLLVVGSRRHGRFAALVLGSVSQQCVRHATCAVAVVPGERFAETDASQQPRP